MTKPGDRHAKLVILSIGEPDPAHGHRRQYEVQCDCGTVTQVRSDNWGRTVSCGCVRATRRHTRSLESERRDRLAAAIRWGGAL